MCGTWWSEGGGFDGFFPPDSYFGGHLIASCGPQKNELYPTRKNVFVKNHTYYLFLLFAEPTTKQTYQLYVGADFKPGTMLFPARVNQKDDPPSFDTSTTAIPLCDGKNDQGMLLACSFCPRCRRLPGRSVPLWRRRSRC